MSDLARGKDPKTPRPAMSRRGVLVAGGMLVAAAAGLFGARWFNIGARSGQDGQLSVNAAYDAAAAGTVFLIDIRRPDEWARTGVGTHAKALDMRRADFVQALLAHVEGNTDAPLALICARGVRSRALAARLTAAGFTHIIDVPEGMLGSGAGPGWLNTGLPVVQPE